MKKDCYELVQPALWRKHYQSTAVCRTLTFYRDSVIVLRPCLQNSSKVPGSKLYYEVVVHKNVFRDFVKYVAMRRGVAISHSGTMG